MFLRGTLFPSIPLESDVLEGGTDMVKRQLPSSVNWVQEGLVTPVKDQGVRLFYFFVSISKSSLSIAHISLTETINYT